MNPRSFRRVGTLLAVTTIVAAGCENAAPTASMDTPVSLNTDHVPALSTVYASGSSPVTAWDPIFPSVADGNWPYTQCNAAPTVGLLDTRWQNPHPAFVGWHPWVSLLGFTELFVNAWANNGSIFVSRGPSGQSWTKYSTPVSGQGDYVVQFLADNCSWIYLDDTLIGVQGAVWGSTSGKFPLTLTGEHTLYFVIFDGGGQAGGKFRLETRQSFIDHGGDTGTLPPPADNTPPAIAAQVSGTLGSNSWYTSDVAVSWTVTDAQSTVTSTSGCGASTVSSDTNGAPFTCSATSAGGTASQSVTVKRDATVPTVGFSGNQGSYTVDQQVAITCSASDAMSGIASSTCPNASGDAYSFGLGAHSLAASATDNAGNASSATTPFTVQVTAGSLCALVERWVNKSGVANSMCQQLENGAYGAFRNHVQAQRDKSVSAAHADILIALSTGL
jgi:hypothetical protein